MIMRRLLCQKPKVDFFIILNASVNTSMIITDNNVCPANVCLSGHLRGPFTARFGCAHL